LAESAAYFDRALEIDPEDMPAHYNLSLVYRALGEEDKAKTHAELHLKYKPDDNARDRAVALARAADPAADHAAEAIVIYDLHRSGAYELAEAAAGQRRAARYEVEPAEPEPALAEKPPTGAAGPTRSALQVTRPDAKPPA
jgi:tetratricopeptide (TPR) repeat protein